MHSPPSPVQPKLCLTPTQTQLLSVITSISGCLSGALNYKSCKTWIKLLEPLMGVEGAVTPSLRFNWPNFSKASGVASGLRFIGSVFVVSLSKYLLASSPTGHKEKPVWLRAAAYWSNMCMQESKRPPFGLTDWALTSLSDGRWAKRGSNVSYDTTGLQTSPVSMERKPSPLDF